MITNSRPSRRQVRQLPVDEDGDMNDFDDVNGHNAAWTSEIDTESESIIRRRTSSETMLQLFQGIRDEMTSRLENIGGDINTEREREREHPESIIRRRTSSETMLQLFQGIRDGMTSRLENIEGDINTEREREREHPMDANRNATPYGSLGDYLIGPGLDLLLQHLAENDPNRYGTPPAQKEAVEALSTVIIKEKLQCSVCLDDFETGIEVKEMPCKHKFHCGCIMPWLDLHSSCPVCRYQLPAEEIKHGGQRESESESYQAQTHGPGHDEESDGGVRVPTGRSFSFPWPFTGLFTSSGSPQSGSGNGSRAAASGSQSGED